MKFTGKFIIAILIVFAAAACSRERNGMDTQNEEGEQNGIGAANDKDANADNSQSDTVSRSRENSASGTSTKQGESDTDFVLAAADGGMLEVRLAALAKQNGSSQDVKEFARTMAIDHGKANDELKNLAKKSNITVPTDLSEKSRQKHDDLSQKRGKEFDEAYAELMVADHQETIEKFRNEANGGQLAEIRDWAEAKIPNLEHHLEMANKLNGGSNTSQGH